MVESIAWVTERKNALSVFFAMLSLLAFLRFSLHRRRNAAGHYEGPAADTSPLGWLFYALSFVCYLLALMSKSVACGLAPILVLLLWWKRPRDLTRQCLLTLPYFIVGALYGMLTSFLERTHVGAIGPEWVLSPAQKFLLASRAICFYIYKFILPINFNFYYDRWSIDPSVGWQWIFPVVVLAALIAILLSARKLGRGPVVAAIAFLALLFPALGFFPVFPFRFSWVADHFAYHASLVFMAALAAVLTLLARRFLPGRRDLRVLLCIPLLGVLGLRTCLLTLNYRSYESLWQSIIDYNPENPHWNALAGMSNLLEQKAAAAKQAGDVDAARQLNAAAQEKNEQGMKQRPDLSVFYYNIAGNCLFDNRPQDALKWALQAAQREPGVADNHEMLARIYTALGDRQKALEENIAAVRLAPRKVRFHVDCARALMEIGEFKRAKNYINNALYLAPELADAHLLNGFLLQADDRMPDALAEFKTALTLAPDNLEAADAYARMICLHPDPSAAEIKLASDSIQRAVMATNGKSSAYLDTWGMLLFREGRLREAYGIWMNALQVLGPKDAITEASIRRHLARLASATAAATATAPATDTAPASAPR
jgi:tetratricopeptide (TPR) repeat protein